MDQLGPSYEDSRKEAGRGGSYTGGLPLTIGHGMGRFNGDTGPIEADEDAAEGKASYQSLFRAIESSYKALDPFRKLHRSLTIEYAGPGYGHNRMKDKYLNKMNQAVDAYTMLLAANRPKVMVSTRHNVLKPFAKHYEIAVNNMIEEIGLEFILRRWVLDAFFSVGIVKTFLGDSGNVIMENDRWMDPGTPFADNVSLDNWVHDMPARKWSTVSFAGDMYRIPFSDFEAGRESGMFEGGKELRPTSKYSGTHERTEQISRSAETDIDEYEPMIDLADVWLPREGRVLTFAVQDRDTFRLHGQPLAIMDWTAGEHGPYHMLGFNEVPDNVMPVSPASHLYCLDKAINELIRKQVRQADRQKDIPIYTASGAKSAKNIQGARDGIFTQVSDINDVGVIKQGGVDPGNQQFSLGLLDLFDSMAGNLTALLGLGAQAETVGQEQLIHDAGSRKGGQMQYRVLDATRRLISTLGGMLWEDQYKELAGEMPYGSHGQTVESDWKPDDREGDFQDYNFDLVVYSMAYQPPGKKVESMTSLIQGVYAPLSSMLTEQGGSIDFQRMTEIYADFLDIPRLNEIITFTQPTRQDTPGPANDIAQGKSPVTTRNYNRRSVPTGGTPQSRSNVMQQALAGQNPNSQQMASMSQAPAQSGV